MESVKRFMEENWNESYTLDQLSRRFAISQTYLKEIFKYMYDVGPATYMKKYRLEKFLQLLDQTSLSIIEIANMVGYSNPSKFSKAFKGEFKILPSKYNRR